MKIYYEIPQRMINQIKNIKKSDIDLLPISKLVTLMNALIDERNELESDAVKGYFENIVLQTKWHLREIEKEIQSEKGQIKITIEDDRKFHLEVLGFSEPLTQLIKSYLPKR